jgi:hypothetical protein
VDRAHRLRAAVALAAVVRQLSTLEPLRPFRWDLAGQARLGSLLDDVPAPDLWFLDELVACAARVLALSADGDLHFVGRSMDSMYDLLSGALRETSWNERLSVLFEDEREQWDVIRLKLRFAGITWRKHTSPNTVRWQQRSEWTAALPPRAIKNVSMRYDVWSYFGDRQPKATVTFRPVRWLDEAVTEPGRNAVRLTGLAEAAALVEVGARRETREELARRLADEPAFRESWLRSLALELRA